MIVFIIQVAIYVYVLLHCVCLHVHVHVGVASAADEASDREVGSQLPSPHRTESARFPLPVRPSDVL